MNVRPFRQFLALTTYLFPFVVKWISVACIRTQVVRRAVLALSTADTVARAGDASCQSNLPRALFRVRRVWPPAQQGRPVRAQRRLAHLLPSALRASLRHIPTAQSQLQRPLQRLVQM